MSMYNATTDVAVRGSLLDLSIRWIDSLHSLAEYRNKVVRVQVMWSLNCVVSPYFIQKFCDIMKILRDYEMTITQKTF